MTASTHSRTAAIVARITGAGDALPPSTPLIHGGLHLDSVAILELLLALENEFAVELDAGELRDAHALRTLSSLCEFIDRKRAERKP